MENKELKIVYDGTKTLRNMCDDLVEVRSQEITRIMPFVDGCMIVECGL